MVTPVVPDARPGAWRRVALGTQLYAAYVWLSVRRNWQYRGDLLFGLARGALNVLIKVAVWSALYVGKDEVAGVTLPDMITYIFLSRLIWILLGSRAASQLESLLTSGDIGIQLVRPGHLGARLFATDLGASLYGAVTNLLPVVLLGLFWLPLRPPASPAHALAFGLTLAGAIVLAFYIDYLVGLCAFWVLKVRDLRWLVGIGLSFFSGAIVPLWFFPEWLRAIADALPFRLLFFVPNAYYLGKLDPATLPGYVGQQLMWLAVMALGGTLLWRAAIRRLVIQGG